MINKKIVIPDKVFHKLWDAACDSDTLDEYYSSITSPSSKSHINLQKYNISTSQIYDVLKTIHNAAHYSIQSLIKEYQFTKASFSHRFCVPIRTVENWCAQTNKCPGYTRLLFLRALDYQILPKGFYVESYCPKDKPSVKTSKEKLNDISVISNENNIDTELPINNHETDYIHFSIRDWEQTHTNSDCSELLAKTDYLSDILKRRSRQIGDDC